MPQVVVSVMEWFVSLVVIVASSIGLWLPSLCLGHVAGSDVMLFTRSKSVV